MEIDHEFVTVDKLIRLNKEAKETDNPLQKRIEEILDDIKSYIKQRESYSLLYLINSVKITNSKDSIKKLLAYIEAEEQNRKVDK